MKLKIDPEIIKKNRPPNWLEYRLLLLMFVLAVLVVAVSISEPVPQFADPDLASASLSASLQVQTPSPGLTATPGQNGMVTLVPTATSVPAEWFTNREMANGIVLGAVALVLIIVGGTLSVIRRKPRY